MNNELEHGYVEMDTREQRCVDARTKFESARTPVGRFFSELRLNHHQRQLEQVAEQVELSESQTRAGELPMSEGEIR